MVDITEDFNSAIAEIVCHELENNILHRQPGHCIQVTDFPNDVALRICDRLTVQEDCFVGVLSQKPTIPFEVSSTKLIELRNNEDQVIVVFIPPGLRTSAEDSFDVSTFERLEFSNLFTRLFDSLISNFQGETKERLVNILKQSDCDDMQMVSKFIYYVLHSDQTAVEIGLNVHYLGLIPDEELFNNPDNFIPRVYLNKDCVKELCNSDKSMSSRIFSLGLEETPTPQDLFDFFNSVGSTDPEIWLPSIIDKLYRDKLTFDKWVFKEKIGGNIKEIQFTDLGSDTRIDGFINIDLARQKKIKINWETNPAPIRCEGLSHFTAEIMRDDAPVTEAKKVNLGKSGTKKRNAQFSNLDDFQDGLYYYRVSAWGLDGSLQKTAESESIYIKGDVEDDDDNSDYQSQERTIQVSCFNEAMIRAQLDLLSKNESLTDTAYVKYALLPPQKKSGGRYTNHFQIDIKGASTFTIPLNSILQRVEFETLSDADSLGRWELDLRKPITTTIQPTLQAFTGINYDLLIEFNQSRAHLFNKILSQDSSQEIQFTVETSDLSKFEDEILNYCTEYQKILSNLSQAMESSTDEVSRRELSEENQQILNIDTILLRLPYGEIGYLVAPTHPLKMLWGLQYSRATKHWIELLEDIPDERRKWSTFQEFFPDLSSLNIPHTLIDNNHSIIANADSFGPYWSIFIPQSSTDVRAQIGRLKSLLGSPESDSRFSTITGTELARKVQRYLSQHPYISTLKINAVQPGSAAILVDTLLWLERNGHKNRYQVHLFSNDIQHDELGFALDEMMMPIEKSSGKEELDAFLTASQNALFPKLSYSKHSLDELINHPENFEAHITFLFDAFEESVIVAPRINAGRSNYVYDLIFEYISDFQSEDGEITWLKQISPQRSLDLDEKSEVNKLFVELYREYEFVEGLISDQSIDRSMAPTVSLALGTEEKNLISQAHQASDWVFTIDRNFGLEYLDNPYDEHCPAYLIDFEPEYLNEAGHRLIISTEEITEIERIVRPALQDLELPSELDTSTALINSLRAISGRLVLKLLSSPQMTRGALGMALARTFLSQAELLEDMVLIPIDSHVDLFELAKRSSPASDSKISLRRTDMLLTELDPNTNSLVFHLVEVKLRQSNFSSNNALLEEINDQLDNSENVLRELYDPYFFDPDRVERIIRTKELSTLLSFYTDRSTRYKSMDPGISEKLKQYINSFEKGYKLSFTKSCVFISLSENGYRIEDHEGVKFHVLGRDKILDLIQSTRLSETTGGKIDVDLDYTRTRDTYTNRDVTHLESFVYGDDLDGIVSTVDEQDQISDHVEASSDIEDPPIVVPREVIETGTISQDIQEIDVDVVIGAKHKTPQFGIIGTERDRQVAVDLNGTNTISLFGVQGSGKSYTLGTILEMATMDISGINQLPKPLSAVVFHYSKTEDYKPEFSSMIHPNEGPEVEVLRSKFGASPIGHPDIMILVSEGKLEERRREFEGIKVEPIHFSSNELDIESWKFLMGVVGSDAMYIKKINQLLRKQRNELTFNGLYSAIAGAKLTNQQFELASTRLDFVKEYVNDEKQLADHIKPGRLIIADLRDEYIEKDEALGLFMVMLKIFANASYQDDPFNKLIVFDEAHKYMETDFIDEVVGVVREMRHKGTSILIASQDPPSVPIPIIELSTQIILHQFNSPTWLKHIQKASTALKDLTAGKLNMLKKGEAFVWARESTDSRFETQAMKMKIRPRVTKHGGETIRAVDEE